MKQIEGIPPEVVTQIIVELSNRLGPRFKFGYHSGEDMASQARLEAIKVINEGKFTPGAAIGEAALVKRLKGFLATHIKNRLNNFIRDYSCRYSSINNKYNSNKYNLMHPIKIGLADDFFAENLDFNQIDLAELVRFIRSKLSVEELKLFLKIQNKVNVSNKKKAALMEKIKEILNEEKNKD